MKKILFVLLGFLLSNSTVSAQEQDQLNTIYIVNWEKDSVQYYACIGIDADKDANVRVLYDENLLEYNSTFSDLSVNVGNQERAWEGNELIYIYKTYIFGKDKIEWIEGDGDFKAPDFELQLRTNGDLFETIVKIDESNLEGNIIYPQSFDHYIEMLQAFYNTDNTSSESLEKLYNYLSKIDPENQ